MAGPKALVGGALYHIYNKGVDGRQLFCKERNYVYFLRLYARHVSEIAMTYAYCLLPNHFHLLVGIRPGHGRRPSQAFSNLFNAYAKAFNQAQGRSGNLFEHPSRRREIHSDEYAMQVVLYIHRNPERHGVARDFRHWPHSSYPTLVANGDTRLEREEILSWFGGRDSFVKAHLGYRRGLLESETVSLHSERDRT